MVALRLVAGIAVSMTVLADVWWTILRPDAEGRIAGMVRRTVLKRP